MAISTSSESFTTRPQGGVGNLFDNFAVYLLSFYQLSCYSTCYLATVEKFER